MNRSTAKWLALLAVVAALFDWKTFLTNQFTLLAGPEGVNYTYSWLRFWIDSVRHGHVPLWDPYGFCGRPFAGEMLPAPFYPLHLLLLLFPFKDGLFSPHLYNDIFLFSHLLCLCFTFALIRELRLSRFAAFVGACCFSLSGLLAGMAWPSFVEAAIWLPAIFLFLLRALRAEETSKAILEAALSGLCLGMSILTGGLHFCMMQGILVLTAVLYYGGSTAPRAAAARVTHWRRVSLILAVILAVSAGAGAVQLIPAIEYGQLSRRFIDGGDFPAGKKIPYHRLNPGMWPQSIVSVLSPAAYGKLGGGEAWASYIGVFPFFLAVTAIWKCWHRVWVRYMTGLALLSFVYTLGEFSPLHGWLYALVPLLWVIREPSRFVYLVSFSLAILAAFGLESLLDGTTRPDAWNPARQILKRFAIGCATALFVPAIFGQLSLGIWVSLSLLLILASCWFFSYLTVHVAGPSVRVLLAAFILFDLTAFHWSETNRAAPSNPDEQLTQMISLRGVAGFLKAQPGLGRVRLAVSPEPNLGDAYGVQCFWGGGGAVLTGYSWLSSRRPDLLNVRYIVRPASASDPAPIYWDEHWKVYEYPDFYPRAWIVRKTIIEPSQDAVFWHLNDPAIDFHNAALLEAPLSQPLRETAATNDQTRFISYEADRMAVEVDTDNAGLMVMSEMYYPGWRATVNGNPTVILRVDGGLRGIVVPRGQSRIELKYTPLNLYAGGGLSLFTFGSVFTALALTWRRRTRRAEAQAKPQGPSDRLPAF
jgi:hypothetical protein